METKATKFVRLPQGHPRREQGFVQGVLLFALAVLVAMIAAFAFANNGSNNSADRENAKVTATVLMKQASDIQDAVSRFVSDGRSLAYMCVAVDTSEVASRDTCPATTGVDLFGADNGYAAAPTAPAAAFAATNTASRVWQYADFTNNGRDGTSTTGTQAYAFMEAVGLDDKVCRAINRILNTSETRNDETLEQCYVNGGVMTYRKVIASRR